MITSKRKTILRSKSTDRKF